MSVVLVSSGEDECGANKKGAVKKGRGKNTKKAVESKKVTSRKRLSTAKGKKQTKKAKAASVVNEDDLMETGANDTILAGNYNDSEFSTIAKGSLQPYGFSSILDGYDHFAEGVQESSSPYNELFTTESQGKFQSKRVYTV